MSTNAAEQTSPMAEFKRAISLVEQTQLEIFSGDPPEAVDAIHDRLEKRLNGVNDENTRLQIMRDVLSDVIEQYNDQYANYISPESLKRYREKRTGSYHGIGLKFRAKPDDYPVVIGALIGGPQENSNLQPGDEIIRAGDTELKAKSSKDIVKLLKGPEGTTVHLLINRDGKRHTVDATRGPVKLEYARSEIISSDIGYLKISRFGGTTHDTVRQQIKSLLQSSVRGIVLDLRDNPGGSTRAARSITSMFIEDEHIYCERYKTGAHRYLKRHGEYLTDLPLAVLVNGNSMSSSEIVAGALQGYERGTIIGEPTYGKGLVQKVFDLAPPLGGAIRTTIAEFATPAGHPIHATGIVPDKFIRTEADFMFRRTGSLNISREARLYQRTLLEQQVRKDHPDNAAKYISAPDKQLQAAIDIIQNSTLSTIESTE